MSKFSFQISNLMSLSSNIKTNLWQVLDSTTYIKLYNVVDDIQDQVFGLGKLIIDGPYDELTVQQRLSEYHGKLLGIQQVTRIFIEVQ